MHAMSIPSTSLSESTAMQLQVEKAISSLPEVAFVFAKTGTAEMAGDPYAAKRIGHFHYFERS
jgi:cobalt-zinc-cadmium resistance protein CzcA